MSRISWMASPLILTNSYTAHQPGRPRRAVAGPAPGGVRRNVSKEAGVQELNVPALPVSWAKLKVDERTVLWAGEAVKTGGRVHLRRFYARAAVTPFPGGRSRADDTLSTVPFGLGAADARRPGRVHAVPRGR